MSLSREQIDLIRQNTDGKIKYWSDEKIRSVQEDSFISEVYFVAYILSSSGLTQSEVADLMGYDNSGVVSRYVYDVRSRIEKCKDTLKLEEIVNE